MNKIYTIGFAGKNAKTFFQLLKTSGAKHLLDVRLNNVSQLAAFSKKDDLRYFLKEILGWNYVHNPELAPSEEILKEYKGKTIDWANYETRYIALMNYRNILEKIDKNAVYDGVLLCSEPEPTFCHRRLLAEYFAKHWGNTTVINL